MVRRQRGMAVVLLHPRRAMYTQLAPGVVSAFRVEVRGVSAAGLARAVRRDHRGGTVRDSGGGRGKSC